MGAKKKFTDTEREEIANSYNECIKNLDIIRMVFDDNIIKLDGSFLQSQFDVVKAKLDTQHKLFFEEVDKWITNIDNSSRINKTRMQDEFLILFKSDKQKSFVSQYEFLSKLFTEYEEFIEKNEKTENELTDEKGRSKVVNFVAIQNDEPKNEKSSSDLQLNEESEKTTSSEKPDKVAHTENEGNQEEKPVESFTAIRDDNPEKPTTSSREQSAGEVVEKPKPKFTNIIGGTALVLSIIAIVVSSLGINNNLNNELIVTLDKKVTDAKQAALKSEDSAKNAANSETKAGEFAVNADKSATSAGEFATKADKSATSAGEFAAKADTSAKNAGEFATKADTSATSAGEFAGNADKSATSAGKILNQVVQTEKIFSEKSKDFLTVETLKTSKVFEELEGNIFKTNTKINSVEDTQDVIKMNQNTLSTIVSQSVEVQEKSTKEICNIRWGARINDTDLCKQTIKKSKLPEQWK